jgi:hypothetical protein
MPKREKSNRKRKSNEKKTSIKKTWEKFVQRSDSRLLLKNVWKIDKDELKEYSKKINKLHKKYSN